MSKIEGTIKDFEGFVANEDVALLREALGGPKCNELVFIDVLPKRSNKQRQEIREAYKLVVGHDIMEDVNARLFGHFKDVVVALLDDSMQLQSRCLFQAMEGMGTNENALIDVLCTKSRNVEIQAIKETFAEMFPGHDLMAELAQETSEPFTSLLITMAKAERIEIPSANIEEQAKQDAQTLFDAGEGRKSGSFDYNAFIDILGTRSLLQLRLATLKYYDQISKKGGIEGAIEAAKCGDVGSGLLAIVKTIKGNLVDYFVERLYKSMKGVGTDDYSLMNTLVSRSEIDLVNIREGFKEKYNVTLAEFIRDDTSQYYCAMLLCIVAGNAGPA